MASFFLSNVLVGSLSVLGLKDCWPADCGLMTKRLNSLHINLKLYPAVLLAAGGETVIGDRVSFAKSLVADPGSGDAF